MITGSQIRAARALLNWSAAHLAEQCKLSWATIQRMESVDGIPSTNAVNLHAVQTTLESAGVKFIGTSGVECK
ncbi:MAG: helix-turn-helix transcriptional regulator, partial [bacterium]